MKTQTDTLFGLTAAQILGVLAAGAAVMYFFGFGSGLVSYIAVTAAIQFRNNRKNRPEAAWEISEKGTRELWNDGPKAPIHKTINSK